MFIETLEFTIPVDLCDLFSSLKRGPRCNMEFPASVNSYGTTQDANIQVALRSNKLTFKVDGVSSDASMISKSECKTLKLSIFDVDRSLMPLDDGYSDNSTVQTSTPVSNSSKRTRDYSVPASPPPPHKSRRSSFSDSSRHNSNTPTRNNQSSSQSRIPSDNVNIKQEPEDPDLIEIEPDDIEPKKEVPYMQIDYSSTEPRTHTSQSALERLSHHPSSYSQSPASSSSSFHQNVPHVQDYAEPGTSHGPHGDQSADDYLVFQEQDENDIGNEDAEYDNDGPGADMQSDVTTRWPVDPNMCQLCGCAFIRPEEMCRHIMSHMVYEIRCLFDGCNVSLDSNEHFQEHLKAVHESRHSLFCPGCFSVCKLRVNLVEHCTCCQKFLDLKLVGPKRNAMCEECGSFFASRQKRDEHVRSRHLGLKYTCGCGHTYSFISGLKRHMKRTGHTAHHPSEKV